MTYEALSAGLPIITTPNTGSVVRDGVDGFVVPIRDPEGLAASMNQLIADPNLRIAMSFEARRHTEAELSWAAYRRSPGYRV